MQLDRTIEKTMKLPLKSLKFSAARKCFIQIRMYESFAWELGSEGNLKIMPLLSVTMEVQLCLRVWKLPVNTIKALEIC